MVAEKNEKLFGDCLIFLFWLSTFLGCLVYTLDKITWGLYFFFMALGFGTGSCILKKSYYGCYLNALKEIWKEGLSAIRGIFAGFIISIIIIASSIVFLYPFYPSDIVKYLIYVLVLISIAMLIIRKDIRETLSNISAASFTFAVLFMILELSTVGKALLFLCLILPYLGFIIVSVRIDSNVSKANLEEKVRKIGFHKGLIPASKNITKIWSIVIIINLMLCLAFSIPPTTEEYSTQALIAGACGLYHLSKAFFIVPLDRSKYFFNWIPSNGELAEFGFSDVTPPFPTNSKLMTAEKETKLAGEYFNKSKQAAEMIKVKSRKWPNSFERYGDVAELYLILNRIESGCITILKIESTHKELIREGMLINAGKIQNKSHFYSMVNEPETKTDLQDLSRVYNQLSHDSNELVNKYSNTSFPFYLRSFAQSVDLSSGKAKSIEFEHRSILIEELIKTAESY